MNVFAKFDEIPSMILKVIKETKRYRHTKELQRETRTVRGSDYSPAIELSDQKDKLVTATGETEK